MAKQPVPDPHRRKTLYARAQSDPQFFHDLVWDTEKVLSKLDFLTRKEKAALLATEPAELLQQLTTARIPTTAGADCGDTCTCTLTCGAGTCTVSCNVTCVATHGPNQRLAEEETWYLPEFLATFQQAFHKFQR